MDVDNKNRLINMFVLEDLKGKVYASDVALLYTSKAGKGGNFKNLTGHWSTEISLVWTQIILDDRLAVFL